MKSPAEPFQIMISILAQGAYVTVRPPEVGQEASFFAKSAQAVLQTMNHLQNINLSTMHRRQGHCLRHFVAAI